MRPNTSSSGILSTKRSRPVNTSMLTRMLVPKPKNAFQSPGTQSFGPRVAGLGVMLVSLCDRVRSSSSRAGARGQFAQRREQGFGMSDPAEDAALGLDHPEAEFLEFREVGADAIL